MAASALYARANMRRMLELHQSGGFKTIHTLPWNFAPRGRVIGNFFDFRIAGCDLCVTQHALGNRRNGGARAGIGAAVAIQALHSMLDVNLMRVGDGLFGVEGTGEDCACG